jgi:hypothetical protein
MYHRHKLCQTLKPKELCFKGYSYREGKVSEKLHEHVPEPRISQESALEALRALVGHFAGWPGIFILHARLNNRSGAPERYPSFVMDTSYPEEGVVRFSVSSGNDWAWFDRVINAHDFRKVAENKEESSK